MSNFSDEPPRRRDDDYGPEPLRRDDRDDDDYDRRFDRDVRSDRRDSAQARAALNVASGGLFGVAALQFICGGIALVAAPKLLGLDADPAALLFAGLIVFGTAVVFVGLGAWARFQPLPPTILGLVIYIGLTLIDLLLAPERVGMGWIIKIGIIAMLARGIGAANKYNQLMSRRRD